MSDPSAASHDPALLGPRFRDAVAAALAECQQTTTPQGQLDAKVFEGFRSTERQAWLYAQGRTRPGKIVTNARTSLTSWHGYGLAVDVVHATRYWEPCGNDSKANEAWFRDVADIFKKHGCQWGGDWTKPDTPHMQWGRCTASPTSGAIAMMSGQGVAAVWQALDAASTVVMPPRNFGALVAGGYFSSTPFDLSMPRSLRTNNPGALNISAWQRSYPGFFNVTQPDRVGNVTTIYRTPEHGVGAWFHLIAARYGFGHNGTLTLRQLAQHYAGTADPNAAPVRTYLAGWTGAAQGALTADGKIALSDDAALLTLGKAMFRHEAGVPSPLHDDQIRFGIDGERNGTLPA